MINKRPYTLLELVAVIGILLIVFGVAVVGFSNLRLERSPFEQIEALRRMAALCRRSAVAQGKTQSITYLCEQRTLQFGNEKIVLPENMELRLGTQVPDKDLDIIRFFPDGNASEIAIEIVQAQECAGLTVSPLTGALEVYEKE